MSRRSGPVRPMGPCWRCLWHGRWPYLALGQVPVRLAPGAYGSEALGRTTRFVYHAVSKSMEQVPNHMLPRHAG